MRFADVPAWRVVPLKPTKRRRRIPPRVRLAVNANGYDVLTLSEAVVEWLGPRRFVQLKFSGLGLALVPADARDAHVVRVTMAGQVNVTPFARRVLGMRVGESCRMPVTFDDGHAVIALPDALIARMRGDRP